MTARTARIIALRRVIEDTCMIERSSLAADVRDAGGTDTDTEKVAEAIIEIIASLQRRLDRLT